MADMGRPDSHPSGRGTIASGSLTVQADSCHNTGRNCFLRRRYALAAKPVPSRATASSTADRGVMVVRTFSRYFIFFLPAEYLCETKRTYECLCPDHRLFHRRAVGARKILGLTWDEIDEAGASSGSRPRARRRWWGGFSPCRNRLPRPWCGDGRAVTPTVRWSFTATASPSGAGARRGAPPVRRPGCRLASSTIRRTAARNLIRASVPERVAMLLTEHKSRAPRPGARRLSGRRHGSRQDRARAASDRQRPERAPRPSRVHRRTTAPSR